LIRIGGLLLRESGASGQEREQEDGDTAQHPAIMRDARLSLYQVWRAGLIAAAQQEDHEQNRRRHAEKPHENVSNRAGLIADDDTLCQPVHRTLLT
jgi:hypothetical protein